MERRIQPPVQKTIMILRSQLEDAFSRGDLAAAQILSRQIDGMQLLQWRSALARAS